MRFACLGQRYSLITNASYSWIARRGGHIHLQPRFNSSRFCSTSWRTAPPTIMASQAPPPTAADSAQTAAKAREEPASMKKEAHLLESFSEIPSITAAWGQDLPDGGLSLTVQTVQRNIPANSQRKSVTTYGVPGSWDGIQTLRPSFPVELKDVLLLSVSPSGRYSLVARKDDKGVLLEVWAGSRLLKELAVPQAQHGPLYNDGWFGTGAEWSSDESRVAYVAEAPADVKTPDWGNSGAPSEGNKDSASPKTWKGVGEWGEDWGELNANKRPPALFVLELAGFRVQGVRGLPADCSVGQPVWTPSGDALVCVVWQHQYPALGRRLGIVYCFNRPCALHAIAVPLPTPESTSPDNSTPAQAAESEDPEPRSVILTDSIQSAFSPQFVASGAGADGGSGDRLVFLSQNAACETGVHSGTVSMHSKIWPADLSCEQAGKAAAEAPLDTSVPVIGDSIHAAAQGFGSDFPGLYTSRIPSRSGTGSGSVLLTSQWRSSTAVLAVDVLSHSAVRVTPDDGSWSLLCSTPGWAVATRSDPGQPPALYAARIKEGAAMPWNWQRIVSEHAAPYSPEVEGALAGITYEVLEVKPSTEPVGMPFEVIIIRGAGADGPQPTILSPHGGPHSAYVTSYVMSLAFLAASGYTVVLVNFRGSTGFGEDNVQSLPGHVGENDVADCISALDAAVAKGYVDPAKVAAVGGSHGGLLTGHLVGQHPTRFAAGVLRNPVMDISLMVHVSDIPDWCYCEAWGAEEGMRRLKATPDAEDVARMRAMSPIAHVDKVTAPLLFMLGGKDQRVPFVDAKRYVAALRAREGSPETQTFVFNEDTHSLDRPQTEFEQWMNVASFLKRHMGQYSKRVIAIPRNEGCDYSE